MPQIVAAASAFPRHYYSQADLVQALVSVGKAAGADFDPTAVRRFFDSVSVRGRHLALPLSDYLEFPSFGTRNDAWIRVGLEVGERALEKLFSRARLAPDQIGLFASTTVTGLAVPSLEARLMNRLSFRPATRRLPLFGLGCVAGAAGIARMDDYLRGRPHDAAVLLSVELCSLTLQLNDPSLANVVACALFGDGAAAVLMVGDEHPLANGHPRVIDTRSVFFPDTERVMGWDVVDSGFRIVLDSSVPDLAKTALPEAVREFLAARELDVADIGLWIAHPGGPKVIDGMELGLGLPPSALAASRESLAERGNLSSASVLVMLEHALQQNSASGDQKAMLLAMGPGFCAELVLLRW